MLYMHDLTATIVRLIKPVALQGDDANSFILWESYAWLSEIAQPGFLLPPISEL